MLPRYDISSSGLTIGEVLQTDNYDVDAPYQRPSVWTLDQKRNLIKSFIMGIPVGGIYVSVVHRDEWVEEYTAGYRVVDGKQRIEAIREFFNGEFAIPTAWVVDWVELNGNETPEEVTINELALIGRRSIRQSTIGIHQVKLYFDRSTDSYLSIEERLEKEAELFLLINTGGTEQSDEDLNRARQVAN